MKKPLLLLCFLSITIFQKLSAQSLQWAYTMGAAPRTQAVALKEDQSGNFYVASFTDSMSLHVSTQLEKRNSNHQAEWQIVIIGDAAITDIEINPLNHVVAAGYFMDAISVDGNFISGLSVGNNSGFMFEADENGLVQWVRALNPVSGDFKTNDLFIAKDSSMYLTSEVSGSYGFCAFHKLTSLGIITKNEFNFNFEDRTFSHIFSDASGNVYLSGTCGNGATFDTIHADPAFSYQNFLVKYDSSFKAQWLITRNYITFDNDNSLSSAGQNLYWAFNDFSSGADTARIIKTDYNGQILASISGPLGNSFFPSLDFAVSQSGNGLLAMNVFNRIFLFQYDQAFNITWQDTIMTGTSGFPFLHGLFVDDSSFYFANYYMYDTLMIDHSVMLINPNSAANFPSDIFVAKWSSQSATSITSIKQDDESIILFPNPSTEEFNIGNLNLNEDGSLKIFDAIGNLVHSENITSESHKIQTSGFSKGIYFLQVLNKENVPVARLKFIAM